MTHLIVFSTINITLHIGGLIIPVGCSMMCQGACCMNDNILWCAYCITDSHS